MNKKFLIIDGSSLVYRAFYALPLLQTRQGLYTNAVYGFATMLLRLLEEEKPDYIAVTFDQGKITFRHEKFAAYKATREKTPGELSEQFVHVHSLLEALAIPIVEKGGFEADDLIGTLAKEAVKKGISPLIVSGDADVFQLVGTPAEVIYTRRGITQVERYTEKEIEEKYGLTANQFIDYKGLIGDKSDNIPGVPGVGEKTALKLLKQFGSMTGIYHHLDEIKGKLRNTLEQFREQAFLSKELSTIVTDVPLCFEPGLFVRKEPDINRLRKIYAELEFKSLTDKLPQEAQAGECKTVVTESYRIVECAAGRAELSAALEMADYAAILPLPYNLSWQDEPHGVAVALKNATYYLPLTEPAELKKILGAFSGKNRQMVVYDNKTWQNLYWRLFKSEPENSIFDVSLAAYLLNPLENGYQPQKLAEQYLQRELPVFSAKNAETAQEQNFSCSAARALYYLCPLLREKLSALALDRLYYELELPLSAVLAVMERTGVAVDLAALAALRLELKERVFVIEREIYLMAGQEFNLNSPKQLGEILFEKLKLPALKKTKTGYSTDAEVLEELALHHEVVNHILQYRMLSKLLATYLEGLSKLVNAKTGRIHTTFNQTVTSTGRLSSTEPNLQNIPIRLEEGRRVRRAFIPGGKGKLLLSADYSQIELRILAHISGDKVLRESFCNAEDIHQRTAAEVFAVSPSAVTREMRDRAKAVNFGIIYGISDYGLSRQLGISRQEAKTYITRYLERLPGVRRYIQEIVKEAHLNGYVTTILNRRRYLPEINSKNYNLRGFAERTAMNTPIQGSAADIIKLAMLRVAEGLSVFGGQAQMILQVHDELVFEVEEAIFAEAAQFVRLKMESAIELSVPLTVDVKGGPNWAQMQKIT
ncbi:MAG: DNA polymerase I [Clostridium sp.]|nr:DNA polymerase I [Clostridium sp.]